MNDMAIHGAAPRSVRTRALVVLFILAVGIILGSVPGWDLCAIAWEFLLAGPILSILAFTSTCRLLVALCIRHWSRARWRGRQAALPIAGLLALPLLGRISQYVELATLQSQLRASAWTRAENGGPHIASIGMDSFLLMARGYAYDDSGEIEKACGTQSAAWQRRAGHAGIGDLCQMSVTHLVGPYYEWFYQ